MSFVESIRAAYRQYGRFHGRATRAEFWWFAALFLLATAGTYAAAIALYLISNERGLLALAGSIVSLFVLFSIVPAVALSVRRLHDSGCSGWLILVLLVPYLGWLIFPALMALPSSGSYNSHGPSRASTSTDPSVQYWGRTRSEALLAFADDMPRAIGAGYEPVWTEWLEVRGVQIFKVWYTKPGPDAPWLRGNAPPAVPSFDVTAGEPVH